MPAENDRLQPEMAKELKALQKENVRLKKMVDEQVLNMKMLKEAVKRNGKPRTLATNDRRGALPFGAPEGFGASSMSRARSTSQYPAIPVAPAA